MGQEEAAGERVKAWKMEVLNAQTRKEKRSNEGEIRIQGVKTPSTRAGPAAPSATQYKPDRVPEDWERSKTKSKGRGNGGVVPGSSCHYRLQDPVSRSIFPKVYPAQLRTRISASCTLSVAGTGPASSSSGPRTVQRTSPTPRLTSSGHPDSCVL